MAESGLIQKCVPVKNIDGKLVSCSPEEATHLTIDIPGPTGKLTLPVMIKGTRQGTGNWSWNGSLEYPTLRPSVATHGHREDGEFRCHSWITDGCAQFLDDCSHDFRGKTVPLNQIAPDKRENT